MQVSDQFLNMMDMVFPFMHIEMEEYRKSLITFHRVKLPDRGTIIKINYIPQGVEAVTID